MHVVDVDVIGFQPLKAALDLARQVIARGARVVRSFTEREGSLARYEHGFARDMTDRLAQNFFRNPLRVDVGRVEEVHARFEADVDELCGFCDIGISPRFKEFISSAERRGAKTKYGNAQSAFPQLPEFHDP